MRRTFVAIDISDDARRAITLYIENMRSQFRNVRVGWERPEKLHLTLKFVGDIFDRDVAALSQIVSSIAARHPKFEITLDGTGKFPPRGAARILWLAVKAPSVLAEIARELETGCRSLGFEPENRNFSPHLTIGRVRELGRSASLADERLSKQFGPITSPVDEIVIYESELRPNGSVYKRIASGALKSD